MKYLLILALIFCGLRLGAQTIVTPEQAKDSVGRTVTVCGIVSGYHARKTVMYLDFGSRYPNQIFSAIAVGRNIAKFPKLDGLTGNTMCVTGKIELFRDRQLYVILTNKSQLKEQ